MFDDERIIGIKSASGENLMLYKKIKISVPPEIWLQELEVIMKSTLYLKIDSTFRQYVEI